MAPIELGNPRCDGNTIDRPYRDEEAGFSGSIRAGYKSSSIQVTHRQPGESELRIARIEAGDPEAAERVVAESDAAIEAISGVLSELRGAAPA